MKCILSIDGGGIRGIIPASIIAEIEKRTGEKIYKLFDLISGTSFSSIIASMSVCSSPLGLWGEEIIGLIESQSEDFFKRKKTKVFSRFLHPFQTQYEEASLYKAIDNIIGNCELKDALTELIIPSYDLIAKQPYIFKRNKAIKKSIDNFKLSDILKATTANPAFFKPYPLNDKLIIDGSIYANNPSMCSLTEAINLMPFRGFFLLSLGCGVSDSTIDINKEPRFLSSGEILSAAVDGINKTVDYEMSQVLNLKSYYRLQPYLNKSVPASDFSKDSIAYLKKAAQDYIKENHNLIDNICEVLVTKLLK